MIAGRVYEKAYENFIETSTQVPFYLMLKMSMSVRKKKKLLRIFVLGSQLRSLRCPKIWHLFAQAQLLGINICQGRYSLNIQQLI